MALTDQQLRQELVKFGETVPPITQRNREQLRTRLEVLRARPRSPVKSSSTRTRPNTSTSPSPTRSRSGRDLIELSDSDTETPSSRYRASRSTVTRSANIPTRSTGIAERDRDHGTPKLTGNLMTDVEESIARRRREIQLLIDSVREKNRLGNTTNNTSSSRYEIPATTPFRPNTHLSRQRQLHRSDLENAKLPSRFNRMKERIGSFWKTHGETILKMLKALIIGILLGGSLILLVNKGSELIPVRRGITCIPDNATECSEIEPMIKSLQKYLKIRTGEVDCDFRPKSDLYVTRKEIDKYLDEKGFKFEAGSDARWETLITYILEKPVDDIDIRNRENQPADTIANAQKLTAKEGIHTFVCRARKTINEAMKHVAWIVLGNRTIGFLSLGWLIKQRTKKREENEKTYKDLVGQIMELLESQYEEHLNNTETQPWLAISHIRDTLISPQDRKRLKPHWERATKHISENESRVRSSTQWIHGEEFDVWSWIQPRSSSPSPTRRRRTESPDNGNEQSYVYMPTDVGLTPCLKLRNFFVPDTLTDDDEIDLVVDNIQNRCATVRRIEHIGINGSYVYLKFSSKESAAQGFHLLNHWKYHNREIIAKYLRLERYHEHFPEARDSSSTNN